MNRLLIGLWVLVFALGTAAVVKNMGAGSTGRTSTSAAVPAPPSGPPKSIPASLPLGSQPNATTTVTIHSENDVLDSIDGVAPPGTTRWDDLHILNQGPGVDVAVAEAVDGSGAIAFYAFAGDDNARAFVENPPLHLAGIGDYNLLQPVPPPAGLPAGSTAADLRVCVAGPAPGVGLDAAGACADGSPPRSRGVIVVVPLDTFALVAAAWDTTSGPAAAATQARANSEAADALAFWAHNK